MCIRDSNNSWFKVISVTIVPGWERSSRRRRQRDPIGVDAEARILRFEELISEKSLLRVLVWFFVTSYPWRLFTGFEYKF